MISRKERWLYIKTSMTGLVVWVGISVYSGLVESWNSSLYYGLGIGVMMVTSGIAGYIEPRSSWRWGISVVILQPIALIVMSRAGSFMFIGLFLFAVFALLCMGAAALGAGVRIVMQRRMEERSHGDESRMR